MEAKVKAEADGQGENLHVKQSTSFIHIHTQIEKEFCDKYH